MSLLGVYGAAGCGREVMAMLDDRKLGADEAVFIDDAADGALINGHRCLTWVQFLEEADDTSLVNVAIANSAIRERLADKCQKAGFDFFTIRASNCLVVGDVEIGSGAILCPFVSLTCNIKIGQHFHTNTFCSIAHDCVIGDFVTMAPGVRCNGNVHIEDHAYIGSGAIIRQGTPDKPLVIGRGAVVGMGAVVTKDVPAGVTVIGNPARPMERR